MSTRQDKEEREEKKKDGCLMLTEEQLERTIDRRRFLKTAGKIALVTAAYEIIPIFPFKEGRVEAQEEGLMEPAVIWRVKGVYTLAISNGVVYARGRGNTCMSNGWKSWL